MFEEIKQTPKEIAMELAKPYLLETEVEETIQEILRYGIDADQAYAMALIAWDL